MNVLGIDTSTAASAACLVRSDGCEFEVVPPPGALRAPPAHARELLPAVARALEQAGVGFADLDAVAVGVGPGSFTGLRIGIATARAIAAARALSVHPVSSLAALASAAGVDGNGEKVLAAIDARRGEVFAALYEGDRVLWPALVSPPEELGPRLRGAGLAPLAVGDGAVRFRGEFEAAGARVPPDDSPSHVVRAVHVCRLARGSPPATPETVLPEYLRPPDAVQTQTRAP